MYYIINKVSQLYVILGNTVIVSQLTTVLWTLSCKINHFDLIPALIFSFIIVLAVGKTDKTRIQ